MNLGFCASTRGVRKILHNWFQASGGGILGTLWVAQPMKVALLKPTFVPNRDTQKVFADVSAQEITGTGYTAGGVALANRTQNYDAANDRTNLVADDSNWSGATFDAAFAVVYDSSGAKPLWSLVDFEGTKSVASGVFTIDWATVGLLYIVPVP
jgi:hypothetical protein